jgi:hypothetical protein
VDRDSTGFVILDSLTMIAGLGGSILTHPFEQLPAQEAVAILMFTRHPLLVEGYEQEALVTQKDEALIPQGGCEL